ncbi:MAG: hypothetical protein AABX88_01465 [Nanoarchaeota archaeon]
MITYNDIYEAAKRNPLVSFELPQIIERRFLIASEEIASQLQGELK